MFSPQALGGAAAAGNQTFIVKRLVIKKLFSQKHFSPKNSTFVHQKNLICQNSNTQNMTKFNKSKTEKITKQNKNLNVTKPKNSKCDKTQTFKM